MNKKDIIAFFDHLAPTWDADMIRHDERIAAILNYGGIKKGMRVLDVACGTGVLFPDYLARDISCLVGVDISSSMIEIAKSKFHDPRITLIHADIEELTFDTLFDCCMVYNAFPHFPDPACLIQCLANDLRNGGRLTVAHGMSRAAIDGHHANTASKVSRGLMSEQDLALLFAPYFDVDVMISTDQMYVVSGRKRV